MIMLTATDHTLQIKSQSGSTLHYVISYADHTSTTFAPGAVQGTAGSEDNLVVPAPDTDVTRQIKTIYIVNKGTAATIASVHKFVDTTAYAMTPIVTLAPGEAVQYSTDSGFQVLDQSGVVKTSQPTVTQHHFSKPGTAPEGAGYHYFFGKDAGSPGAWAVGTPGVGGRSTDAPSNADAGAFRVPAPPSGKSNYLLEMTAHSDVGQLLTCADVIVVNSGLSVTSTTSQTCNTTAIPERDLNGESLGTGMVAAILVTGATGNGGAVNPTISYTNQDGSTGRTGTMTSPAFPASATVGTLVFFQMQEGDTGIRSIQSYNNVTSLVSGSISLMLLRPIMSVNVTANALAKTTGPGSKGVKLYNGSCLLLYGLATGSNASTINGTIAIGVI